MSLFGDIAGLAAINTAYQKLGNIGEDALLQSSTLAQNLYDKGRFTPFAVRSNIGTTNVLETGSMGSYLGGQALTTQQRMFNRAIADVTGDTAGAIQAGGIGADLLGRTTGALDATIPGYSGLLQATGGATAAGMDFMQQAQMPVAQREQQVFERIRAAQAPEEARRRLELEERLATQGRLGVSTNLYGGTPEQLALSRAQAEAQNTAMLQAMQQAREEQAQAGALGQQFGALGGTLAGQLQNLQSAQQVRGLDLAQTGLGLMQGREALEAAELQQSLGALKGALLPEAAQLNLFQQGLQAAKLRDVAQQYRTGLFGEAGMTGIDALLASGLGQATLIGNVGSGVLAAGAQSNQGGLFDALTNLFKGIPNPFSDIRLKENVEFIGKNNNGFNIYRWDWNEKANELGEHGSSVGVIAQDLLENHSDKVSVDSSGYYKVDYTGIWG
jgi:hypothetical protein